jgi:hypothetical protein
MTYLLYACLAVVLNLEAPQAGLALLPFIPEYTIKVEHIAA